MTMTKADQTIEALSMNVGICEDRPFYGHLEAPMYHKIKEGLGLEWAFVHGFPDTDELRLMHDREYVEYKWVHAHDQTWDGDFESWLEAGKPMKNV